MAKSSIEWTDKVWNPIVGCKKVSPGCAHCFAERFAYRLKMMGQKEYQSSTDDRGRWTGEVTTLPDRLEMPMHWRKPQRVFVNSMSDLFHPDVPKKFIENVFAVMALNERHTFMVLTKRQDRMFEFVSNFPTSHGPIPNVWLGVSVEDQKAADQRIPVLLKTPAAVRFVSCEPLLGAVNLFDFEEGVLRGPGVIRSGGITPSTPDNPSEGYDDSYPGLDWVIAGGESGPNARPMHPDWARALRDQCIETNTPFFFKQWGEWFHISQKVERPFTWPAIPRLWCWEDGTRSLRIGKLKAGRLLDGKTWSEFPCTKT